MIINILSIGPLFSFNALFDSFYNIIILIMPRNPPYKYCYDIPVLGSLAFISFKTVVFSQYEPQASFYCSIMI